MRDALSVGATHDEAVCLCVILHEVLRYAVDLQRQFARGRNDNHARAIAGQELGLVKKLDGGQQERQCLTAAGLGCTEEILACEQGWNRARLQGVSICEEKDYIETLQNRAKRDSAPGSR